MEPTFFPKEEKTHRVDGLCLVPRRKEAVSRCVRRPCAAAWVPLGAGAATEDDFTTKSFEGASTNSLSATPMPPLSAAVHFPLEAATASAKSAVATAPVQVSCPVLAGQHALTCASESTTMALYCAHPEATVSFYAVTLDPGVPATAAGVWSPIPGGADARTHRAVSGVFVHRKRVAKDSASSLLLNSSVSCLCAEWRLKSTIVFGVFDGRVLALSGETLEAIDGYFGHTADSAHSGIAAGAEAALGALNALLTPTNVSLISHCRASASSPNGDVLQLAVLSRRLVQMFRLTDKRAERIPGPPKRELLVPDDVVSIECGAQLLFAATKRDITVIDLSTYQLLDQFSFERSGPTVMRSSLDGAILTRQGSVVSVYSAWPAPDGESPGATLASPLTVPVPALDPPDAPHASHVAQEEVVDIALCDPFVVFAFSSGRMMIRSVYDGGEVQTFALPPVKCLASCGSVVVTASSGHDGLIALVQPHCANQAEQIAATGATERAIAHLRYATPAPLRNSPEYRLAMRALHRRCGTECCRRRRHAAAWLHFSASGCDAATVLGELPALALPAPSGTMAAAVPSDLRVPGVLRLIALLMHLRQEATRRINDEAEAEDDGGARPAIDWALLVLLTSDVCPPDEAGSFTPTVREAFLRELLAPPVQNYFQRDRAESRIRAAESAHLISSACAAACRGYLRFAAGEEEATLEGFARTGGVAEAAACLRAMLNDPNHDEHAALLSRHLPWMVARDPAAAVRIVAALDASKARRRAGGALTRVFAELSDRIAVDRDGEVTSTGSFSQPDTALHAYLREVGLGGSDDDDNSSDDEQSPAIRSPVSLSMSMTATRVGTHVAARFVWDHPSVVACLSAFEGHPLQRCQLLRYWALNPNAMGRDVDVAWVHTQYGIALISLVKLLRFASGTGRGMLDVVPGQEAGLLGQWRRELMDFIRHSPHASAVQLLAFLQNHEPALAIGAAATASQLPLRLRVLRFYARHNPEKIDTVDETLVAALENVRGGLRVDRTAPAVAPAEAEAIMRQLIEKYGPEPGPYEDVFRELHEAESDLQQAPTNAQELDHFAEPHLMGGAMHRPRLPPSGTTESLLDGPAEAAVAASTLFTTRLYAEESLAHAAHGDHGAVLRTLVFDLDDLEAAERYCFAQASAAALAGGSPTSGSTMGGLGRTSSGIPRAATTTANAFPEFSFDTDAGGVAPSVWRQYALSQAQALLRPGGRTRSTMGSTVVQTCLAARRTADLAGTMRAGGSAEGCGPGSVVPGAAALCPLLVDLVRLLLRPPPGHRPRLDSAASILCRHSRVIDPNRVLSDLPGDVNLSQLSRYFSQLFQSLAARRARLEVLRHAAKQESTRLQAVEAGLRSRCIVTDEARPCTACRMRLGDLMCVVYPNLSVVHFRCAEDRTRDPVRGVPFAQVFY